MQLESAIVVRQSPEQVWDFFNDPLSLAKWDRSVERVVVTSEGPARLGFTFDTIAPTKPNSQKPGMIMHYRITQYESPRRVTATLVDSPMFRNADWYFELEQVQEGTRIFCRATFTLQPRYLFLAPVLLLNKRAIDRDMTYLKEALEMADAA